MKALVVEDQQLFREAVADELTFYGFNASTAEDGEEGLMAASVADYDVILSDMRMPKRDGRWFLGELRKTQKCAPPFIFMTGFTDLTPQDAFEMGADGFLGKPVDSDRLRAVVSKVCKPIETRWEQKPDSPAKQIFVRNFDSIESEFTKTRISLGRGGMFLAADETPLRTGDLVEFKIHFKEGPFRSLEGIGTIVWKRDSCLEPYLSGYGIDFEFLTEESLPEWLNHLRSKEIVPFVPKS
ncbi:MAG: response regulator [Oligoflexus sp.]|nr:response regulator [Oligoflexus sp.]